MISNVTGKHPLLSLKCIENIVQLMFNQLNINVKEDILVNLSLKKVYSGGIGVKKDLRLNKVLVKKVIMLKIRLII